MVCNGKTKQHRKLFRCSRVFRCSEFGAVPVFRGVPGCSGVPWFYYMPLKPDNRRFAAIVVVSKPDNRRFAAIVVVSKPALFCTVMDHHV